MMRAVFTTRLSAVATLAVLLLPAPHARAVLQQDEAEVVERYLARLGLVDLQMLQLETTLQTRLTTERRVRLAQQLADLYAGRLMTLGQDTAAYDRLLSRIRALMRQIPAVNTPALQVMLLQADYNRAETQMGKWLTDGSNAAARKAARQELERIAPLLDKYQQQLNDRVATIEQQLEDTPAATGSSAREQELRRLQAVAGRATYFAAWSQYYLGLSRQQQSQPAWLRGRTIFKQLLGVDDEPLAQTRVEWLGLESLWRSRALIGLGITELALANSADADRCFEMLQGVSVSPVVKEEAATWRLQGLLLSGRFEDALEFARERMANWSGQATAGRTQFCVVLARFANTEGMGSPSERRQLSVLGLGGLARLGELRLIRQFVEKHELDLANARGFVMRWIHGQQLFAEAERSKSADDYRAAAEALEVALEAEDSVDQAPLVARAGLSLGWCHLRLGELEKAEQRFYEAYRGLRAIKDESAVEAAWMAAKTRQRLNDDQPRYLALAVEVYNEIQKEYPNHPYARQAKYAVIKLLEGSSTEQLVARLEQIPPGDANYLSARFDLCELRYSLWRDVRGEVPASTLAARQLHETITKYLDVGGEDADQQRVLQCLLWGLAASNAETAPAYLSRATALAESIPASQPKVIEFHYRAMQWARASGDNPSLKQHAAWLADHAAGTAYELAAVVCLAQAVDSAVASAEPAALGARQREAYDAYHALVGLLGDDAEQLGSQRNAQVASSKLAHYAYELRNYSEAAERLEKLLASFPKNKDYVRRAGLAQMNAGHPELALAHWRRLLTGLQSGTEEWYEAKFYQLQCLVRHDKELAKKVYQQFKLLHPDLGPPNWRERFKQIERSLS